MWLLSFKCVGLSDIFHSYCYSILYCFICLSLRPSWYCLRTQNFFCMKIPPKKCKLYIGFHHINNSEFISMLSHISFGRWFYFLFFFSFFFFHNRECVNNSMCDAIICKPFEMNKNNRVNRTTSRTHTLIIMRWINIRYFGPNAQIKSKWNMINKKSLFWKSPGIWGEKIYQTTINHAYTVKHFEHYSCSFYLMIKRSLFLLSTAVCIH